MKFFAYNLLNYFTIIKSYQVICFLLFILSIFLIALLNIILSVLHPIALSEKNISNFAIRFCLKTSI